MKRTMVGSVVQGGKPLFSTLLYHIGSQVQSPPTLLPTQLPTEAHARELTAPETKLLQPTW